MKFINKLERKFGRYAIQDLMKYIIVLYVLGAFLYLINPYFYNAYLSLDVGKVLKGQVWRLVTFIIYPADMTGSFGIFFFAIEMYLYYMIGRNLENAWGAFRFNLYYISGILFNVVAAFILYFILGVAYPMGLTYINRSMFFAFAAIYPNIQFLLFFVLPVKVKHLAYIYAAIIGYDIIRYIRYAFATPLVYLRNAYLAMAVAIIVALLNFIIFFFTTRNYKRISPAAQRRRKAYHKQVNRSKTITRHKCAVCGRTEEDDENLEFRFCSKCDGNYEYCMEHLFTHTHVKK
ncbi:hypothetical protein [Anaerosporobacter faecicola]|uniref:hypothetical protein n=1 Tax=Anaerosporobacter faecicola TaxID=2718714 RepID=UPI00143B6D11|nr:hypothetical protein [Anaerosporobacter faecicola]